MGLFDIVREKVSELMSGAGEKVTEVTGVELPGGEAADQVAQSADNLTDTATSAGQGIADTATGAVQDVAGSAGDAVNDVTDPRK